MSAAKGSPAQIVHIDRPLPLREVERLIAVNPCAVVGHRPAWLNGGGVACGVCGARL